MDLYLGIAVVLATLLGPVLAILVTRFVDNQRARDTRRLEIFKALMRTRRAALLPDHVNALNLVEIEFHGVPRVLSAYRELMRHINTPAVTNQQWTDQHRSYLTKLLSAMAEHLGYTIEQLAVLEGGYYPSGWGALEEQQLALRLGLLEVLNGRRALPVQIANEPLPTAGSIFQPLADRLTTIGPAGPT